MSGRLLYPRLTDSAAAAIREDLLGLRPDEAAVHHGLEHPATYFAAVGGVRVTTDELVIVRKHVMDSVHDLMDRAFAGDLNRQTRAELDIPMGRALHDSMDIIPGDAASPGVWSFMSMVLLPEIAVARFPDGHVDRWLGRPRNVLRRAWWREHVLGDLLGGAGIGSPLGEDELVGIFERPTIAADPRLSRALAMRILEHDGGNRSEFARRLLRRVLAEMAVIEVAILSDDELQALIDDALASRMSGSAQGRLESVDPPSSEQPSPRSVNAAPVPVPPPPARKLSIREQRDRLQRLMWPSGWGPPNR